MSLVMNYQSNWFLICKLILKKNSLVSANFGKFNLAAPTALLHFPSWVITRTNRKQIFIISIKAAMLKLAFSRSIRALVIKISFYLCMCTLLFQEHSRAGCRFTEHRSVMLTELIFNLSQYCKNIPFLQAQVKTEISVVHNADLPASLQVLKIEKLINW